MIAALIYLTIFVLAIANIIIGITIIRLMQDQEWNLAMFLVAVFAFIGLIAGSLFEAKELIYG